MKITIQRLWVQWMYSHETTANIVKRGFIYLFQKNVSHDERTVQQYPILFLITSLGLMYFTSVLVSKLSFTKRISPFLATSQRSLLNMFWIEYNNYLAFRRNLEIITFYCCKQVQLFRTFIRNYREEESKLRRQHQPPRVLSIRKNATSPASSSSSSFSISLCSLGPWKCNRLASLWWKYSQFREEHHTRDCSVIRLD